MELTSGAPWGISRDASTWFPCVPVIQRTLRKLTFSWLTWTNKRTNKCAYDCSWGTGQRVAVVSREIRRRRRTATAPAARARYFQKFTPINRSSSESEQSLFHPTREPAAGSLLFFFIAIARTLPHDRANRSEVDPIRREHCEYRSRARHRL